MSDTNVVPKIKKEAKSVEESILKKKTPSLKFPIRVRMSLSGNTPASLSLLALITIMNRMSVSPSMEQSNGGRPDRQVCHILADTWS